MKVEAKLMIFLVVVSPRRTSIVFIMFSTIHCLGEMVCGDYVCTDSIVFSGVTSPINMAQENTVSFKVFLQNEGANEVRRFGVDRDVVSNFGYLREKLQAVFPSLRGCIFTVAWRGN
jgi:hypothetical protein